MRADDVDDFDGGLALALGLVVRALGEHAEGELRLDVVGRAVPVVQDVEAILARAVIVPLDERVQRQHPGARSHDVRAHRLAQPQQRLAEVFRFRHVRDQLVTGRSPLSGVHQRARVIEADLLDHGRGGRDRGMADG